MLLGLRKHSGVRDSLATSSLTKPQIDWSQEECLEPANQEQVLRTYYHALYAAWGAQHWWPGETQFEVIVGAYLTPNTAWTNVERALANLRDAGVLSLEGIRKIRLSGLERLIRPSGYFRQKAARIKTFVAFLDREYGGSIEALFSQPTLMLREQLLSLNGVGPETADSILLYAGNHAVFVVDAYTRRMLDRHNILTENADYEEIRELFERALRPISERGQNSHHGVTLRLRSGQAPTPRRRKRDDRLPVQAPADRSCVSNNLALRTITSNAPVDKIPSVSSCLRGKTVLAFPTTVHAPSAMSTAQRTPLVQIYNEMHGLLVGVGKHFCGKSQPQCDGCPLQPFLPAR
jgi:endonuclease III related protein